jgi:peptide deformylase
LQIIKYPHPTLRRASKPLRRVDAEIRRMIRQMFDLMYEAKGVGLAANQVDLPYRMFIMNLKSDPKARDEEHVFINPVLSQPKGTDEAEEGCLSLPGLYADVRRYERIQLSAFSLAGEEISLSLDGLMARVVQHETDHLEGVLFIDRLTTTGRMALREELEEFEIQFAERRERGEIPDDRTIAARLAELEAQRT